MTHKRKVAVLGSTGLVGQHFVRMLDGHPDFKIAMLAGSERSAGHVYAEVVDWAADGEIPLNTGKTVVQPTSVETVVASGAEVVFSALPASIAGPLETALRGRGLFIFTNASSHRADPDVPVVIPEINPDHLELAARQKRAHGGFIVADSNCSTSGLALLLAPLRPLGIRSVVVTTFQAISGAGRRGLAAMDIAANCIPFIPNEEEKLGREPGRILGTLDQNGIHLWPVPVRANCCRVPVRDGHLLSVSVEFDRAVEERAAAEALTAFRGLPQEWNLPSAPAQPVIVRTEEARPQPVLDAWAGSPERARGMAVTAGRLRSRDCFLDLFGLVHNTVRGAAGTCLLTAELALKQSLLDTK
ncbi:MAG: aspartate-semialdehyde dehydrogenase [Candidatus Aminicenantes bacterium]|nr:aspartate-semialdehyde dehydrogenase [Candidatus Aminicenantes bacterium]